MYDLSVERSCRKIFLSFKLTMVSHSVLQFMDVVEMTGKDICTEELVKV